MAILGGSLGKAKPEFGAGSLSSRPGLNVQPWCEQGSNPVKCVGSSILLAFTD